MNTIELTRQPVDQKQLIKKSALLSDTEIEYSEPAIFTLDGKPIIFYGHCDFDVEEYRRACLSINYVGGVRTSGLAVGETRVIGAIPRDPVRKDFTSLSALAFDYPRENALMFELAQRFDRVYAELAPLTRLHQADCIKPILDQWKIRDTVFTSGIINKSNPLKYHLDRGNFKGALSCMLTLKKDIAGGCLSLPEFNCRLKLKDASYLLFDGQSVLHGVTPIQKLSAAAYRYTIVFYSLEALLRSKTPDEELADVSRRSREKYSRRAGLT